VARGFTTVELLVVVALLAVMVVAVGELFDLSSEAAGRTAAHADLMAASAALQQHISDLLSKMVPGLLIIESPAPTGARADIPGGRAYYRLRHDRLVFIASGGQDEFQSFTDPTRGTPGNPEWVPVSSSQALIYFGPGIPLGNTGDPRQARPFDDDAYALAGSEWMFAQRTILLALEGPNVIVPDWGADGEPLDMLETFAGGGGMLNGGINGGKLHDEFVRGQMDVVVSDVNNSYPADAATFVELILNKPLQGGGGLLTQTPDIRALWQPNYCPTTVTVADPDKLDYYLRSGFTFQPRLADFRIEWTDGRRMDPLGPDADPGTGDEDYRMRWFGLRPDPGSDPDFSDPPGSINSSLDYVPIRRQDVVYYPGDDIYADTTAAEEEAFGVRGGQSRIEWSNPAGGGPAADAAYRAIWRADTWQFRPTALRFTYRIYDPGNRLKHTTEVDLDEDGDFDPDDPPGDSARYDVSRYGKEFSIVVPIP
jgi:type II secretory pathway pseudopilin PulG